MVATRAIAYLRQGAASVYSSDTIRGFLRACSAELSRLLLDALGNHLVRLYPPSPTKTAAFFPPQIYLYIRNSKVKAINHCQIQ